MSLKKYLKYSLEVQDGMKIRKPVVALESSVIAQGLPHPHNVDVTLEMMQVIRDEGCVPAVTLVDEGFIKVGLEDEQIEDLALKARKSDFKVYKASLGDITALLANKQTGATTVAGTMYCSYMAGVKYFATGGIGGVHRGAELSFDVSTDLLALKEIPVAVVSSGVKSILDIPKTLEMLETFGVPVIGYKTQTFPQFFSSSSEYPLLHSVADLESLARVVEIQLSTFKGMMIANPVPEKDSLDPTQVEGWLKAALKMAEKSGISGKALTPFLLSHLSDASKGQTLEANRSLLVNNARIAAQLAKVS